MKCGKTVVWAVKTAAIYLAVTAASVANGLTFYQGVEAAEGADPAAVQHALFAINAAYALMLATLAARMRGSRIAAAALLFALFFVVQTLLSQMEAVYFADSFDYPLSAVPRDMGAGLVLAAVGAVAAAILFKPHMDRVEAWSRVSLGWRFALATALYPVAYWTAGLFIAWRSEAVRAFYDNAADIEPGPLLAFQILRGALWAGLALAAAYGLRGSRTSRAVLTGAAFSVFMAAQLFYPNPLMPEAVRMVHLVEIGVSNFIYGFIAVMLLAPRRAG